MDEIDRRLAASGDRLRGRIDTPPAGLIISRARRRRAQRRAQIAVVGVVAALAIAVPVASMVGGRHRAEPAGPPAQRPPVTVATTVTVTDTPSDRSSAPPAPTSDSAKAPRTSPSTVAVGRPILGIGAGYELFARSSQSVARIQFALGRVTVKPVPAIQSGAGAFFVAGRETVIARAWDFVPGFLLPDDGPATDLPGALSGGGGFTLPGPRADQVWVQESTDGAPSGFDALRLVGLDGTKTSTSIPMSGAPLAPDGEGYVLVRGADCLYDVRPDGRSCIASGDALNLLAVGPTGWLVHPCADGDRCRDVYIDRKSGSRHSIDVDLDVPQWGVPQWGVISPDGAYAAMLGPGPKETSTVHLVDLTAGTDRVVRLASSAPADQPSRGSGMVWSPDGRWLFVAAGAIHAVDPATGRVHTLSEVPGDADFFQLAMRPAADQRAGR